MTKYSLQGPRGFGRMGDLGTKVSMANPYPTKCNQELFKRQLQTLSPDSDSQPNTSGKQTAIRYSSRTTSDSWHRMTPHSPAQRYLSTRGGSYDVR